MRDSKSCLVGMRSAGESPSRATRLLGIAATVGALTSASLGCTSSSRPTWESYSATRPSETTVAATTPTPWTPPARAIPPERSEATPLVAAPPPAGETPIAAAHGDEEIAEDPQLTAAFARLEQARAAMAQQVPAGAPATRLAQRPIDQSQPSPGGAQSPQTLARDVESATIQGKPSTGSPHTSSQPTNRVEEAPEHLPSTGQWSAPRHVPASGP